MISRWYKEPWAWLLVILPLSSVCVSITIAILASQDPDPLVIGDYYKEGKAINQKLGKLKAAEKRGINFDIQLASGELLIKPTGLEKLFPKLNVDFYHSTLEDRDFQLTLTPDGNGYFRHQFDEKVNGKWTITITPFDDSWKLQKSLNFPLVNLTPMAEHYRDNG